MPAIGVHHTATDDGAWDGPANEARLKLDQGRAFYSRAYAWRDPDGDESKKSTYKFIHHVVDEEGNPGTANVRACQTGIGVLNGGRGGTTIPESDRQGVYNHLAAHLRDADVEPPELKALTPDWLRGSDGLEVRGFPVGELRAVGGDGEPQAIEGYAAVYNQRSELLWGFFHEVIETGFFEGTLHGDIRSLWNHNTDYPLGRTINETLELKDEERGLHIRVSPPETSWGKDALVSIGRGDVSQMSFAFEVKEKGDHWVDNEDGTWTRYLKRGGCSRLYEVSPVTFPAYPQTSAVVRSTIERLSRSGTDNGPGGQRAETDAAGAPDAAWRTRHNLRRKFLELLKIK
ncbi:MAG TPA: HK97 family phage prohead protease [Anaerolineales bacterium]|nr:HK97 family phage prohead protease [Anaerolineales bacterium]